MIYVCIIIMIWCFILCYPIHHLAIIILEKLEHFFKNFGILIDFYFLSIIKQYIPREMSLQK